MPRFLVPALILTALVLSGALGCAEPAHRESRWALMGTQASAQVYTRTESGAEDALSRIHRALEKVEGAMSNRQTESELSRLNLEAAHGPFKVQDPDLYRCIRMALAYARATDGAFDPTVGPLMGWRKVELMEVARALRFSEAGVELDLGGIVEGYALDVAARVFARVGCQSGLLELGDSLYAWNHPPHKPSWTVKIPDPEDGSRLMATLELASRALATSSKGRPARSDVIAATTIADSGADADAFSTALLVAGSKRGSEFLQRARRVEAVLLVRGREGPSLLVSASLKGNLEVAPEFHEKIGGRVRYLLPPLSLEGSGEIDLWERLVN